MLSTEQTTYLQKRVTDALEGGNYNRSITAICDVLNQLILEAGLHDDAMRRKMAAERDWAPDRD